MPEKRPPVRDAEAEGHIGKHGREDHTLLMPETTWCVQTGGVWVTWDGKWRVADLDMGINVVNPRAIERAKQLMADPSTEWVQKGGYSFFQDK